MTSLRQQLSALYFRPKAFELDGKVYEWLAVIWFKRRLMGLVRASPRSRTPNAYFLGGRSLEDLLAFEGRTRRCESIHLLGLSVSLVLLFLAASLGERSLGAAGFVVFVANFHCLILQRYNRIRVLRVVDRAVLQRSILPGRANS